MCELAGLKAYLSQAHFGLIDSCQTCHSLKANPTTWLSTNEKNNKNLQRFFLLNSSESGTYLSTLC